jgi:hypothetical protein
MAVSFKPVRRLGLLKIVQAAFHFPHFSAEPLDIDLVRSVMPIVKVKKSSKESSRADRFWMSARVSFDSRFRSASSA